MMPSRLALFLLYCTTCLSFCRSAVAAPNTTNLAAGTSVSSLLAQNSSPTPADNPLPMELFPGVGEQKPSPKPKPATSPKSNLSMLWIGTGTVLVIIAGILLYIIKRSEGSSDVESETPPNEEEIVEEGRETAEDEENAFSRSPNLDSNLEPERENLPGDNRQNHQIPDLSFFNEEQKVAKEPIREELQQTKNIDRLSEADRNGSSNSVLSNSEDKNAKELVSKPPAESVEVRETTRLAKINIVDELIKELQSPDPTKRRRAIWELAQRGDSRAIQPLVNLLLDADSQQRSLILEAVSQIGDRTLKPLHRALVISLQDDNAEVRKNAIRDVTRIYETMGQINQLLRHAISDPDPEVQETARWAINQLNRIRGVSGIDFSSFPNGGSSWEKPPEN